MNDLYLPKSHFEPINKHLQFASQTLHLSVAAAFPPNV